MYLRLKYQSVEIQHLIGFSVKTFLIVGEQHDIVQCQNVGFDRLYQRWCQRNTTGWGKKGKNNNKIRKSSLFVNYIAFNFSCNSEIYKSRMGQLLSFIMSPQTELRCYTGYVRFFFFSYSDSTCFVQLSSQGSILMELYHNCTHS